MFKLAFRNIFRNRLRTALTLAAIVTGVVAIIISGGFIEDVFVQLRESTIHSRLGHIQIFRQGYLEHGRREPSHYMINHPENVVTAVNAIPHTQIAMTRINFSGLANNGYADIPIIGEGIEPDKEERLGSSITMMTGRILQNEDKYGIVIGEGVAAAAGFVIPSQHSMRRANLQQEQVAAAIGPDRKHGNDTVGGWNP